MRTESELEAMAGHPAGKALNKLSIDDVVELPVAEDTAHGAFFHALDDLENDKLLYGAGSVEAAMARARVQRSRERVIEEWRRSKEAA
jgi:hypothetical protein